MKKTLFLSIIMFVFTYISNAQCNADFSYAYTNGGWTIELTDLSTATTPNTVISWDWTVDGSAWSTNQNPPDIQNGGTHYVCLTIMTSDSCSSSTCDTVTDSNPCQTFSLYMMNKSETRLHNDGLAIADANGGSYPYSYSWSTGYTSSSTDTLSNLSAGMYAVTVEDASGCTNTDSIYVALDTNCYLSINTEFVIPEHCFGQADGWIEITPHDGLGNITYNWSNGDSTQNIYNLGTGNYSVTVEDQTGCIATENFTIISDIVESGQIIYCPPSTGYDSAFVTNVSFTTASLADVTWTCYKWGTPTALTTVYNIDTCNSCFLLEVHIGGDSSNYCPNPVYWQISDTICRNNLPVGITSAKKDIQDVNIYPNPAYNELNIAISSKTNQKAQLMIHNSLGQFVRTEEIELFSGHNELRIDINNLENGIYLIRINEVSKTFIKN